MIISLKSVLAVTILAWFFYRSMLAVIPLSVLGVLFFRQQVKSVKKEKVEMLEVQFKECILSVSTSLQAGYAVENAFMESRQDMKLLFGDNSEIYRELEWMRRGMVINLTLEELLAELGERSGSEEIRQFSQVFMIAKRSGGNLPEVIRTSADMISAGVETKQEIHTLLSGRKMEQNIMKVVPFFMLFYIGISYPGFFDDLYYNLPGISIMTGCLLVYLAAYVLGEKIMEQIQQKMQ